MTGTALHTPVLLGEVLESLNLRDGARCVDATVDGGGHATAVLAATAPGGRLLGIERDPEIVANLQARMKEEIRSGRLQIVIGSFQDLDRILREHDFCHPDGILFDLGLSSFHLDTSGRGFTIAKDEPLDMRFDTSDLAADTAAGILAERSGKDLTQIFRTYGEERFASRIARTVVARRRQAPLRTTHDLLEAVRVSLPPATRWRFNRHAARIFQSLRIAVNRELDAVENALPQALAALRPGGRLAVISFHSLEDRFVKHFFRAAARDEQARIITKKPLRPSEEEVAANPRAASAKLRVAERL